MFDEPDSLTEADVALDHELTQLGPRLRAISHARSDAPDPEWAAALRLRIIQPADTTIRPAFERRLRKRLVGRTTAFGVRGWFAVALLAVAAVAVALALILHPFGSGPGASSSSALPPPPTTHDLLRNYPYLGLRGGGGGGGLSTTSLAPTRLGEAYPSKLRLTARPFRAFGHRLPTYRLSRDTLEPASLRRTARRLGISARLTCSTSTGYVQSPPCPRNAWRVVAEFPTAHRFRLHSLALSPLGEVVYMNLPFRPRPFPGPGLSRTEAVRVARDWLTGMGWQANRMRVLSSTPNPGSGTSTAQPIVLTFGWIGHIHATVPAATVSVTQTRRVLDAEMWPPIVRTTVAPTRSVAAAWLDVADGRAPIAVERRGSLSPFPPGRGHVSRVTVVQLLVTPNHGPAYLEPVYKFSGSVRLGVGVGTHPWYALVPTIRR
jgi:hypothetical protein